jgi:hypothetical protein
MSKVKLTLLCLILAFLALVIPVFSNPPLPEPFTYDHMPPLPLSYDQMPVKPNPDYLVEKVISPSWAFLSINSGNKSAIGKPSGLARTIVITKITPSIGEIILNNTNNTMPVNVSGWHLDILSIDHSMKEVIANGSVIPSMGQLVVSIPSLDSSGVVSLADSAGKIVDRVPYAGNWTKAIKS